MSANIEYFCCRCGLYYNVQLNKENSESINYVKCPNTQCKSHLTNNLHVIRVGTIKFNQLLKNHSDFFHHKVWGSNE